MNSVLDVFSCRLLETMMRTARESKSGSRRPLRTTSALVLECTRQPQRRAGWSTSSASASRIRGWASKAAGIKVNQVNTFCWFQCTSIQCAMSTVCLVSCRIVINFLRSLTTRSCLFPNEDDRMGWSKIWIFIMQAKFWIQDLSDIPGKTLLVADHYLLLLLVNTGA